MGLNQQRKQKEFAKDPTNRTFKTRGALPERIESIETLANKGLEILVLNNRGN